MSAIGINDDDTFNFYKIPPFFLMFLLLAYPALLLLAYPAHGKGSLFSDEPLSRVSQQIRATRQPVSMLF